MNARAGGREAVKGGIGISGDGLTVIGLQDANESSKMNVNNVSTLMFYLKEPPN